MSAVTVAPPGLPARQAMRTRPAGVTALGILVAIAPFDLAIPQDGWTAIHLRPLMLTVIAVSIWLIMRARRSPVHSVGALDGAVLVWLGVAWISTSLSDAPLVGAAGAIRLTAFGLLVVATHHTVVTSAHARFVLRCLVAGIVGASIVGLVVLLAGREVFGTDHLVGSISHSKSITRLTRPWSNANVAAMAVGASLPCAALLNRAWRLPAAAVVVSALVLTYSRGAMIALLAGAVVVIAVRPTRTEVGRVATVLGLALAVAVASPGWGARLNNPDKGLLRDASIEVPQQLVLDPDGITIDLTVSNLSTVTWSGDGIELSAMWVGAGQNWVWGEHRWPLADGIEPGESVEMALAVDASIPAGTFDVRWDIVDRRGVRYLRSLDRTTSSRGVVFESPIDPADVEPAVTLPRRSALDRIEIWRLAAGEFLDAPVLGVGPSELGVAVTDNIGTSRRFSGRHAHSLILEPLATTGVLGAAALFFVLLGAGALAARRALQSRDRVPLAVLAGLTVTMVHGLFDWPLVYTSSAVPIAVLTGIAWTWRVSPAGSAFDGELDPVVSLRTVGRHRRRL